MSIRNDTETHYCSTAHVAKYFGDIDAFPSETDADPERGGLPSREEVEEFIEKWSARVDRRTGQSWRANRVVDETHDHRSLYYWLSGHPINCLKRNIISPLDPDEGDKLEVYTGNGWEDWLTDEHRTEGRGDGSYWVDGPVGIIYIYERAILRPHPKFRISYRYGNPEVPADIREAVAGAAAADLINSDFYGTLVPGNSGGSNADPESAADVWRENFHDTVRDYKKVRWV